MVRVSVAGVRSSLSLQRSLYRHQQRQIDDALQSVSSSFRRYERAYKNATAKYDRRATRAELIAALRDSDVVYVGDYHTLAQAQAAYCDLVRAADVTNRPVVIALEFVLGRHQAEVDRFVAGKLSDRSFLTRIGHPYSAAFDVWPAFKPIFELASKRNFEILAIDSRASGPTSIHKRDNYAATRIRERLKKADRPQIFVLMGQFHIAPKHLPAKVQEGMQHRSIRQLIIYQNAERLWWKVASSNTAVTTPIVRLRERQYCLFSASPIVCQRSFLDYVHAESGDKVLTSNNTASTFLHLVRSLARLVGVRIERTIDRLAILTPEHVRQLEGRLARSRLSRTQLSTIKRALAQKESLYIPQAHAVWLARLSLNQAAEEAARLVRATLTAGVPQRSHARPIDRFWNQCLEEALAYFGSRLVNPSRQRRTIASWAAIFESKVAHDRTVAAFVLALWSPEATTDSSEAQLLPRDRRIRDDVARALGQLLGEELARAFDLRKLRPPAIRALFATHFDAPHSAFLTLRRTQGSERIAGS